MRLFIALGIFALMLGWEYVSPKRTLCVNRRQRWSSNLGLAVVNMIIMRLTVGGLVYLTAVNAKAQSIGVLNALHIADWLAIIISMLVLDFAIYCQHIASHHWTLLWRLHQVHHTDLDFDATTAVRFHPLEIMLSMAYKVLCVYVVGAHPSAVIAFEIILNGAATFNHSNIKLPAAVDNTLRWLIVTPDMHRIHHSTVPLEMDSNYGFSITWWDRLFKTYRAKAQQPQTTMTLGLNAYRQPDKLGFGALLLLPFKSLLKQ